MDSKFIQIDGLLVNEEILTTKFTCDLSKCKGACCTMKSDYGAPVTDTEISMIDKNLGVIKEYLPSEHLKQIEKNGFWEEKEGILMTRSYKKQACVFVYYDGDIAKCGIERAYRDGRIDFLKPISCHLFPVRVRDFGGPVLRFEKYDECSPALKKGQKTGLNVLEFCNEALTRAYGSESIAKLQDYSEKKC